MKTLFLASLLMFASPIFVHADEIVPDGYHWVTYCTSTVDEPDPLYEIHVGKIVEARAEIIGPWGTEPICADSSIYVEGYTFKNGQKFLAPALERPEMSQYLPDANPVTEVTFVYDYHGMGNSVTGINATLVQTIAKDRYGNVIADTQVSDGDGIDDMTVAYGLLAGALVLVVIIGLKAWKK